MAKLSTLFDASKVAPQVPYEVIPKGKYPARIIKSELKPTKDRKGSYIEFQFELIDGEYKGRQLFDRLNIKNANAKAVEIANAALSAICHATGVMKVADTIELHNKPMLVSVVVEPAQYDDSTPPKMLYDAKNEIKGYEPLEGAATATAASTASASSAAAGKWAKPAAASPAPATETAGATGKKAPPAAKAKPAPEPEPEPATLPEGTFYVQVGTEVEEHNAEEVKNMLAEGMPADTPVCKEGDDAWMTAEHYGISLAPVAAAEPAPAPAPAKKPAPWLKK